MFISLNKKFIYSIISFFLITAFLFIYTFFIIYGVRYQEELKANISRNQQYIDILNENSTLRREIRQIIENNHQIAISSFLKKEILSESETKEKNQLQTTLSKEKKRIEEQIKSYEARYSTIKEGFRIVSASSILIILAVTFLWFLMRRWVLTPLEKITSVSNKISQGNLSCRIQQETHPFFSDEIDILSNTFNNMLENMENNIKEIKEKERFLQSLIDGIPDGLRVIDQDYNIIIANKEYYKQVGKNKNHAKCYQASQNLNSPCSTSMVSCPLHEICTNKKQNIKVIQQFASNLNRHLSINAAPLHLKGQTLVVEVIRDLSDDIKFSHQQKLSSLGFIATSVAHEMKNYLGSIRMITESILNKYYKDKTNNNEEKKLLTLVHSQIIECINVPERLLKLSRFSGNEVQKINCLDNIKDVISLLDYDAKRNGTTIEVNSKQEDIFINGYEADFKMIIINLILNAIKAIKSNGLIKIDISASARKAIIKISDNGHGISKEALPRIFEPFYSEGRDCRIGGTGLGLSIVKSIVEKFKGTISVSSKVDIGTCFTLKFPLNNKK